MFYGSVPHEKPGCTLYVSPVQRDNDSLNHYVIRFALDTCYWPCGFARPDRPNLALIEHDLTQVFCVKSTRK